MADVPHGVDGRVLLIKYNQQRRCGGAASQRSAVQPLSWEREQMEGVSGESRQISLKTSPELK